MNFYKKRQLLLQILLAVLFCSLAIGQENKFKLYGTIKDCKTKSPIEGVTIKLIGKDNSSNEVKSNSEGHYSFNNCLNINTNYVVSTIVTDDIGFGNKIKYGVCPYENTEKLGYLNSSAQFKFTTFDTISNKNILCNFCLIPIEAEYRFPDFFFKKNSMELINSGVNGFVTEDTTIDCLVGLLLAKKTWVLEISGHSDRHETNPQKLSKERAEKIRDILVAKGIDTRRLVLGFYGSSRMLNKNCFFNKEKLQKNRRVVLSVLRSDFNTE